MATLHSRTIALRQGAAYLIRHAEEADGPALIRLIEDIILEGAFSNTEPGEQTLTLEGQAKWIGRHRDAAHSLLVVAESEGEVIGMLNFENGAKRRLSHQGAFGMTISPAHRGFGVGRALLDTLLAWAQADAVIEKINLTVLSTNERAIAFYRAAGFQEQGRMPKQVKLGPDAYADHILMCCFTPSQATC